MKKSTKIIFDFSKKLAKANPRLARWLFNDRQRQSLARFFPSLTQSCNVRTYFITAWTLKKETEEISIRRITPLGALEI